MMTKTFKKISLIIIFVCVALAGISAGNTSEKKPLNPNFDLSSVKKFWPVMETLLQNLEPTTDQWR